MRTSVVRLVVPDGSGALPVGSVAWRWSAGDDVVVPGQLVDQSGAPLDWPATEGDSLALAFWLATSTASEPDLQLEAAYQGDPEAEDFDASLVKWIVASGSLAPGEYEVAARIRMSGARNPVLQSSRLVVDADRADV